MDEKDVVREYGLRDKSDIRSPARYAHESRNPSSPQSLKRQRGGKKGAITKRIKVIQGIISTKGSRTKLRSLIEQLRVTLNDAKALHEELMRVIDHGDDEYCNDYIEQLSLEVDNCISDVSEYLEERFADPPSLYGSQMDLTSNHSDDSKDRTNEWCKEQGVRGAYAKSLDVDKLSSQLQAFSLQDYELGDNDGNGISNIEQLQPGKNVTFQATFTPITTSDQSVRRRPEVVRESQQAISVSGAYKQDQRANSQVSAMKCSYKAPGTYNSAGTVAPMNTSVPHCRSSGGFPSQLGPNMCGSSWDDVRTQPTWSTSTTYPTYTVQGMGNPISRLFSPTSYLPTTCAPHQNAYSGRSHVPNYPLSGVPYPIIEHPQRTDCGFIDRNVLRPDIVQNPSHIDPGYSVSRDNGPGGLRTADHLYQGNPNCRSVDGWIDQLPDHEVDYIRQIEDNVVATRMMERWMVNQNLPQMEIPKFDGSATLWVDFITQFKEIVHLQPYLTTARRMAFLLQHLEKEARRAVGGFKGDWWGYTAALKRLKFMFGQRARVAHAHISKVTKGKPIKDMSSLTEFYYDISDCLSNLLRLGYTSDLESTDVLRQAVSRLPTRLRSKWCEKSYSIRRTQEPNLHHLSEWLGDRIMAARDPYVPKETGIASFETSDALALFATGVDDEQGNRRSEKTKWTCLVCKEGGHMISRCQQYNEKDPEARFKFVKGNKLCFNCLKPNHSTKTCTSKFNCFIPGCRKSHHTSLHENFLTVPVTSNTLIVKDPSPEMESEENSSSTGNDVTLCSTHTGNASESKRIYFKTVPVKVISQGGRVIRTYAFLDDGSEGTFIRKDLADVLKVKGRSVSIKIGTIVDERGENIKTKKVAFTVSGIHANAKKFEIDDALILPCDKFHAKPSNLPPDFKTNPIYKHLQEFKFNDVTKDKIQLLIGADNYKASLVSEVREGADRTCPAAVKTPLGWSLFGRGDNVTCTGVDTQVYCIQSHELSELNDNLVKFWSTESFGTEFKGAKPYSIQDRIIEQEWDVSTTFKNGHYMVSMPWKDLSAMLPDNRQMAENRFRCLTTRFKRNPELHLMYKTKISEYVEMGYVRKMSLDEVGKVSAKTWYLPHHPVTNIHKPNKVRPVFDAAASFRNVSLNDQLHTGPDLVNSLIGVLLRFRNYPIAVTADIEAMFHQVHVSKEDSDSLRFLWQDDIHKLSPDVYQMLVHVFGAKSSPACSTYALRKCANDSSDEFPAASVNAIHRDFYVDDFLKSTPGIQETTKIVLDVIEILQKRGFNLTKFMSNSHQVLEAIPKEKQAHQEEFFDLEDQPLERTLGVRWSIKTDTFTFAIEPKQKTCTKRGILKTMSTVFDPLGFLTPFTVRAKILFQDLWRKKYDWDDLIDEDSKELWLKWLSEMSLLPQFKIPRCYLHPDDKPVKELQLHVFADASEVAFGAVGYIRTVYQDGTIWCCMLFSKSRLAPIKKLTIPRLELQAAVLAVRIKNTIMEEINVVINNLFFWSDSTIVLQYINNETKRFRTFVANRVAEIREHSVPNQWNHVRGDQNPADAITRGASITQIDYDSRWVRGPDFLRNDEKQWPSQDSLQDMSEDDNEIKVTTIIMTKPPIDGLKKYSSWYKLLRIVGWMLRFIKRCKGSDLTYNYLTLQDLKDARISVFRSIQREHFHEELCRLEKGEGIAKGSPFLPLNAYVDDTDGLIRVGGRIGKAETHFNAKHQVVLPSKDYLVSRLVDCEHKQNLGCGPNQLLGQLQENYWIFGAKKLIKKTLKSCMECKKRTATPQVPLMAPLPKFRVDMQTPVFYNTGVDFFGPINTKIGRRLEKRWGALFTCMVTRAVHLEVAEALSTDAFINVLQRFINRRGYPSQIVSDCGTNFKGANRELVSCLKELEHDKLTGFAARKSIHWIFNPPGAPHMGGVWERLVRSVKVPLQSILKDRTLTDLQLSTVFTEVESLINSRPLTAVSEDPDDLEALTPNHFLLGRQSPNLPFNIVYKTDHCSRKRWREVQFVLSQFWRRWTKEYLPRLTVRPKWNSESRSMKVGDIVIIVEKDLPRGMWKLGRVIMIYPGDDGRVRVVKVKSMDGIYTRPVAKLCLLEESQMATGDSNEC